MENNNNQEVDGAAAKHDKDSVPHLTLNKRSVSPPTVQCSQDEDSGDVAKEAIAMDEEDASEERLYPPKDTAAGETIPRTPPSSPAMHAPLLKRRRSPQPLSSKSYTSLETLPSQNRLMVVVDEQVIEPRPPLRERPLHFGKRSSIPGRAASWGPVPGDLMEGAGFKPLQPIRHPIEVVRTSTSSDRPATPHVKTRTQLNEQFDGGFREQSSVWDSESRKDGLSPGRRYSLPSLQLPRSQNPPVSPPLTPPVLQRLQAESSLGTVEEAPNCKLGRLTTKRPTITRPLSPDQSQRVSPQRQPSPLAAKANELPRHPRALANYPTAVLNDHKNDPSSIPVRGASPNPLTLTAGRHGSHANTTEAGETMGFLEVLQMTDSRSASPIIRPPPPMVASEAPLSINTLSVLPPIQMNKP